VGIALGPQTDLFNPGYQKLCCCLDKYKQQQVQAVSSRRGVCKQWNGLLEWWNSGMENFKSLFSKFTSK